MSGAFTTATYFITIGAGGAILTAATEVIWTWTKRGVGRFSQERQRRDTKITIRIGDTRLNLETADTADAVRLLERLLSDQATEMSHPEDTSRSDQAEGRDSET